MKSYALIHFVSSLPQAVSEMTTVKELMLIANNLGSESASQPIFYTWLLFTLTAIMLTFLITWYILRKKHQQTLNQLRIQLSADLHDDVGTLLAGLAMQAELLGLTSAPDEAEKLNHLATVSREAQSRLRDIVWSYDARKDTWQSLLDRLSEYAQEVLAPKGIQFDLQLEGIASKGIMSGKLRKAIYLIGKEAIANVTRHSDANKVVFSLKQLNGQFELTIQDNGHITEKTRTAGSGLGMSNIKMRAKRLGAKLNINLQHGFGVELRMGAVA